MGVRLSEVIATNGRLNARDFCLRVGGALVGRDPQLIDCTDDKSDVLVGIMGYIASASERNRQQATW